MSRSNSTTGITATQFNLRGKVALVTGASRGVGRGIAIVLADAGATVYITGRTVEEGAGRGGLPGSITSTAAEIAGRGGTAIAIACDHTVDAQTNAVFEQIDADQGGKVDILVNNVWGGYENLIVDGKSVENLPFWEQPTDRWNAMFDAGVHAHYVCSVEAAKRMVPARSGLIVTISFWAAQKFMSGVAYGSAKAADDKMCRDMGHQLRPHEVAVIALSPGLVRTEYVMRFADYMDLSNSESPEFTGRAVAALAQDPNVMRRSGQVLVAAKLAREYGFTDVDGTQPIPLTLNTA